MAVLSTGSETALHGFESWICHVAAARPWALCTLGPHSLSCEWKYRWSRIRSVSLTWGKALGTVPCTWCEPSIIYYCCYENTLGSKDYWPFSSFVCLITVSKGVMWQWPKCWRKPCRLTLFFYLLPFHTFLPFSLCSTTFSSFVCQLVLNSARILTKPHIHV